MNRVFTWRAFPALVTLSDGRFLTWRMRFFRARAPSGANTRKSEIFDNERLTSWLVAETSRKRRFLPLFGENRCDFSSRKCPWNAISILWSAISMGCCRRSVPWIAARRPRTALFVAKRRTGTGVRFNGLPNSAHGFAAVEGGVGWCERGAKKRVGSAAPKDCVPDVGKKEEFIVRTSPPARCGVRAQNFVQPAVQLHAAWMLSGVKLSSVFTLLPSSARKASLV